MSWKSFPKIELHLHLEGAADPAFIRGLAKEKSVDLQKIFDENGNYKFGGFGEFLSTYEAATQALQSPNDFKRLTQSVLENLAEHNVVYAEAFISPDFCGGRDLGAWREYLAAMQEAHVAGVTLKGIVTCIRHFGPEKARETAKCAAETAGDWIGGFVMSSEPVAVLNLDSLRKLIMDYVQNSVVGGFAAFFCDFLGNLFEFLF